MTEPIKRVSQEVGLFSSGGIGSANTFARLKTEKNTREMTKALQAQNGTADSDAARVQWCIDRILLLEAEVARLQRELESRSGPAT